MNDDSLGRLIALLLAANSFIFGLLLYKGWVARWPARGQPPHPVPLALVTALVLLVFWTFEGYADLYFAPVMPFSELPDLLGYGVADFAQQMGRPTSNLTYRTDSLLVWELKTTVEIYAALALTLWGRNLRYRLLATRKPPH